MNPIATTRDAWRAVGETAGVKTIEIETIFSSAEEHKHQVETQVVNIERLVLPTWGQVLARDYEQWQRPRLVIHTVGEPPEKPLDKALRVICERMAD